MGVVITGTSSGIGLAAAIAFARAGHEVHASLESEISSTAIIFTELMGY